MKENFPSQGEKTSQVYLHWVEAEPDLSGAALENRAECTMQIFHSAVILGQLTQPVFAIIPNFIDSNLQNDMAILLYSMFT